MIAVRIRPNVVLPELEAGLDGCVPIGEALQDQVGVDAFLAKLAGVTQALGLDENAVRERLAGDPRYAHYRNASFPRPRATVTEREARLLVQLGLAEPVDDPLESVQKPPGSG